ncbi:MAG: flagellar biosynthetic protein FliO [Herminiimonas sp.]|uniref:flagellar biosynthetic protein FliO n=1 Tax=Herminiimonas sp. TaxID=1926289 RepID=UPI00271E2CB2|nr:flagellar biosynthetic protein FliO [Herminiimonas sp.]MDO9421313.1 flagellar biosynthetic protein FliO [Herminiimonas sp.]
MIRAFSFFVALFSVSVAHAQTAAVSTAATTSTSTTSTAGNLMQVTLGLLVVLALMAAAAWVLRRFNTAKGQSAAQIKIIGGVSVGNRERVMVVEIADQWIVVGVAPGRVNALATMAKQETTIFTDAAPSKNFSSWLAQTIEKRNAQ